MTKDSMRKLRQGDRVRVRASGKVYQVTYTAAWDDAEELPHFRQVALLPEGRRQKLSPNDQTLPLDGKPARLYGPAFVRLKPENVDALATRTVHFDTAAQLDLSMDVNNPQEG